MSQSYDYLIVGAGILGLSLGAELASRNKSVLIIEQHGIAGGASGGNLGQISLMDRFEDWHLELALESLEYYAELSKKKVIGYRQHGGSILLMNDTQITRAEEVKRLQNSRGLSMEILSPGEARSLEPNLKKDGLLAMAYCKQEGCLDPLALTFYMADLAVARGATIRTGERVLSLSMSGREIDKVISDKDSYRAKTIINCAGGWSSNIAALVGEAIPIKSHKGTAFVTQPMPPLLRTTLVGGGFLMEDTGEGAPEYRVGTAICQHENGSIIIGQATEAANVDERSLGRRGLSETAKNIIDYFPILESTNIIRAWALTTSYSVDGKPVMGYSPKVNNLFTVAGFKGAFTTVPAVARRAAAMLLGGETFVREIEPAGRGGE